ncbi:pancreatic lipase-related protein 3-like [Neocloeon triangulifer]|nr:pancreatic lipase-related protein 3-like [Neocloeon triangulifer]
MANISTFPVEERLDPGDAYFVDVIDTDSPSERRPHDFGHANFYISRPKPSKCHVPRILRAPTNYYRKEFCGHGRAFEVYARSVMFENAFPAMRCASYAAYRQGLCREPEEAVPMGFKAPNSARGSYFLFNEKELFGLGNAVDATLQTSNQIGQRRATSPAGGNPFLWKQLQDFFAPPRRY